MLLLLLFAVWLLQQMICEFKWEKSKPLGRCSRATPIRKENALLWINWRNKKNLHPHPHPHVYKENNQCNLLQDIEVTFNLRTLALRPILLIAQDNNIRWQFTEAHQLNEGIDAIFHTEVVDDIVECFNFTCIEILLAILDALQTLFIAKIRLPNEIRCSSIS